MRPALTIGEVELEAVRPVLMELLRLLPDEASRASQVLSRLSDRAAPTWMDLLMSASYHGVLGVLQWHRLEDGRAPASVQHEAQRAMHVQDIWHRHLMKGLTEAVEALASADIEACSLKGPVLAERIYPQAAARHAVDVDLLVRPQFFDPACDALVRHGYRTSDGQSRQYQRQFSHHLEFSDRGRAPIELHFRAYAGFGVEVGAEALLDRATTYPLSETLSVLTPAPEDEFVYLATHAAGHSFIRLVWLYDLKMFVRRFPGLDWDVIAARAVKLGVSGPVAYATRLLHEWLGVTLPPLPSPLQRRKMRVRVADRLLAEVSRPQPRSVRDNLGGLVFMSLLCDRAASGAWLLQHHAVRSAKRRLHQKAPRLLPAHWSA